jgi:TolB-like protein/Tfp pilus assembly protein PilF
MFTDIVGYTRLMGSDEEKAVDMLSRNRSLHQSCIEKFNGTLIKEIGDGILASFSLASEAVRCAMDIQKECKEQGIPLKIGIHEGEMIFSGSDVIGDGVNIASRLLESTEDGCIAISATVYGDIKNKADLIAKFIGERTFKNVEEPVKVYHVVYEKTIQEYIRRESTDLNKPEKKSIIVLPFVNISTDPDQEYFSDGLTEEIITDLSHVHDLLVISRNSAMTFKGTKKNTREIGREVNVRYVLEGSVRKSGNNLRIIAQLIDAEKDVHLWAEKYTGTLEDVFDIQEKVSRSIAEALQIKLSTHEKEKMHQRPIDNAFAYDCFKRSYPEVSSMSKERIDYGLNLLQKGLKVTGDNAVIYAGMANAYFQYANIGFKAESNLAKGEEFLQKALNYDPDLPEAHFALGGLGILKDDGKAQDTIGHWARALKSSPDDPEIMIYLALLYSIVGQNEAAHLLVDKVARIDPINPMSDAVRGWVYFISGKYDLAVNPLFTAYELSPENAMHQFFKALILFYNHRASEAYDFIDDVVDESSTNIWTLMTLFIKYTIKNDKEKIASILTSEFVAQIQRDLQHSYHIATFYSYLEEKESALDWLENAVKRGFINFPLMINQDPFLENIRSEPRFKKLMVRAKQEWNNFKI